MGRRKNSNKKTIVLKDNFIKDYFYLKQDKIAILENKAIKNVDEDLLILVKVVEKQDGIYLEQLTEEEYALAIKKYDLLVKAFSEEEING